MCRLDWHLSKKTCPDCSDHVWGGSKKKRRIIFPWLVKKLEVNLGVRSQRLPPKTIIVSKEMFSLRLLCQALLIIHKAGIPLRYLLLVMAVLVQKAVCL